MKKKLHIFLRILIPAILVIIGVCVIYKKNNSTVLKTQCKDLVDKVLWESETADLDGNGNTDHIVVGEEKSHDILLGVMTDTGKKQYIEFKSQTGSKADFVEVQTGKLDDSNKDYIVVQLTNPTSNYGSSDTYIFSLMSDTIDPSLICEVAILDFDDSSTFSANYVYAWKNVSMVAEDELIQYVDEIKTNAVKVQLYEKTDELLKNKYIYYKDGGWHIYETE